MTANLADREVYNLQNNLSQHTPQYTVEHEQKALEIIDVMRNLMAVMDEENKNIRLANVKILENIFYKKNSLSNNYAILANQIVNEVNFKDHLSPHTAQLLEETAYDYHKSLQYNEARLHSMIQASYDILETMVKDMQHHAGTIERYGRKEYQSKTYNRRSALTVDQNL